MPAQASSLREHQEDLVIPLFGGIATMGEYYVKVSFVGGGDSQTSTFRLQLDTGSSSLVLAGRGCQNCTSRVKRAPYEWTEDQAVNCSSRECTASFCDSQILPNACGFRLKYGDNTPQYNLEATGVVARSTIALKATDSSKTSRREVFAYVVQHEVGRWPNRVDGILGLAFERLNCNPNCFPLAWREFEHGGGEGNGFSICLGDEGGELRFLAQKLQQQQGVEARLPLLRGDALLDRTFYAVKSLGLAVVEEKEEEKDKPVLLLVTRHKPDSSSLSQVAIIDSGTTLLIVPQRMYDNLRVHMQTHYCHLPGVCGSGGSGGGASTIFHFGTCLRRSPFAQFPTLALVFDDGDAAVVLPPELYFIKYGESVYCFAIQPSSRGEFIVGDALLRGYTVKFDSQHVTFSDHREPGCGKTEASAAVGGVAKVLTSGGFRLEHIPELHHRDGGDDTGEEAESLLGMLAFSLLFWVAVVTVWRVLFRRQQLGYRAL